MTVVDLVATESVCVGSDSNHYIGLYFFRLSIDLNTISEQAGAVGQTAIRRTSCGAVRLEFWVMSELRVWREGVWSRSQRSLGVRLSRGAQRVIKGRLSLIHSRNSSWCSYQLRALPLGISPHYYCCCRGGPLPLGARALS